MWKTGGWEWSGRKTGCKQLLPCQVDSLYPSGLQVTATRFHDICNIASSALGPDSGLSCAGEISYLSRRRQDAGAAVFFGFAVRPSGLAA